MPLIQFTQRALDALDRLYGFVGGVSRIDRFNMGPVNLVHDVSREAEASMGFQATIPISMDTVGGSTRVYGTATFAAILSNTDVANKLSSRGLDRADVDVWLMGFAGLVTAATAANFANAGVGALIGNTVGTGEQLAFNRWTTTGSDLVAAGTVALILDALQFSVIDFPILLPDDESSVIRATLSSGAGGQCVGTVNCLIWVGPKGTFPPRA